MRVCAQRKKEQHFVVVCCTKLQCLLVECAIFIARARGNLCKSIHIGENCRERILSKKYTNREILSLK